jgi:signal transduction histidine kinase
MKAIALLHHFALFVVLSFPSSMHASDCLLVNRHFEFSNITKYAELHYDPCKCLNIHSLQDTQLAWQAHHHPFVRLEKDGRYWLRFTIINNDDIPLFFHIGASSIELYEMRMFVHSTEYGWDSTAVTGNYIPIKERPIPHRHLMYSYLFYPEVHYTLYIYLEKGYAPVQTALDMSSPLSIIDDNNLRKGSYSQGTVLGFSIMHFIMALFIFLFLCNSFHLAHVSYALGGVGYLLASSGSGIEYVWTNAIYFEEYSAEIFATLMLTGLFWMANIQLNTKLHYRWLYYLTNLAMFSGWLFIMIVSFRFVFPSDMIGYITLIAGCFGMCTLPCVMVVAIIDFFKHKNWDSLWFVLVFAAVMTASMLMLITELGIIERTIYINNTLNLHSGYVQTFFVTLFVANRAFMEIETRKLALIQKQLAHQEELQRISRDLHDDVGSTLSSIAILSELSLQQMQLKGDATHLATIAKSAKQVMENMNDIVWSVSPENNKTEAWLERLKAYALEVLEAQSIQLHFSSELTLTQLPTEQRNECYLIFKEAINNAAKYSEAKNVWVSITQNGCQVKLHIQDDGKGFDVDQVKKGNGLKNMKKRTERLSGTWMLKSKPSQGTEIQALFHISPIYGMDKA